MGEVITTDGKPYHVIGLIKDMLMSSPYEPVKQTFFFLDKDPQGVVTIRINPRMSTHEALEKIAAIYQKYSPAAPFDYKFADEEYAKKFDGENTHR